MATSTTLVLVAFGAALSAAYPRVGDMAEAARRCAAQEKLLYSADGKCYDPATGGPCDRNRDEFFVLDTNMSSWYGRCQRRPCRDGKVKWTDGECYDRNQDLERLCPIPGHIVGEDAYGIGECVCHYIYARHVGSSSNWCYKLYTRGPCPEKSVLVPKPKGKRHQGVCAWDPCHQYQRDGENQWLFWEVDGKCHQVSNPGVCTCPPNGVAPRGQCGPDYRFTVNWDTLKPGCVANNVLNLTPDARCTGCQTTQTEHFDRRIFYQGGGS